MKKEKKINEYVDSLIEDGINEYLEERALDWFYSLMDKTLEE